MLGLHFCARAFSSCGGRGGPLFIAVRGPLTIAASLAAEHRLQTRRLSSCGSRAQLLRGMWDLPRPRFKPVSPCIGRQTLNHCATREALFFYLLFINFHSNLYYFLSSAYSRFSLSSFLDSFPANFKMQQEATAIRSPRTTKKSSGGSPQLEKARAQQRKPNEAKNK